MKTRGPFIDLISIFSPKLHLCLKAGTHNISLYQNNFISAAACNKQLRVVTWASVIFRTTQFCLVLTAVVVILGGSVLIPFCPLVPFAWACSRHEPMPCLLPPWKSCYCQYCVGALLEVLSPALFTVVAVPSWRGLNGLFPSPIHVCCLQN